MARTPGPTDRSEQAEALALEALAHLAGDPERLGAFLGATGIGPDEIRALARQPEFLGAVLDHLLSDDALVLDFCRAHDLRPESVMRARTCLPGAPLERDLP